MENYMPGVLIVHGGTHHADDATVGAIMQICNPFIRIHRPPNNEEGRKTIERAKQKPGVMVADTGGEYDPERLNFDHHHTMMPRLDYGYYASAGLVWKTFGARAVQVVGKADRDIDIDEADAKAIAELVDEQFIRAIDTRDVDPSYQRATYCDGENRIEEMTIADYVAGMNAPSGASQERNDAAYLNAANFLFQVLRGKILDCLSQLDAWKETAQYATEHSLGLYNLKYVVIDRKIDWRNNRGYLETVRDIFPKACVVIYRPAHRETYSIELVRESWLERTPAYTVFTLEPVEGIDNFVHPAGFIASAKDLNEALVFLQKQIEHE